MNTDQTSSRHLWLCVVLSLALGLGIALFSAKSSAQELKFYRFKNADGITVISTKIPSQFIGKGYDIVTSDGRLIERVAAEPSAAEKQRILEEQAEAERLKKRDRALLSRYSSVGDIKADRSRKLAQFDADIKSRRRNIEKVNEETTLWQSKAADEERLGQPVSAATLEKLAQLREQKAAILLTIEQKEQERLETIRRYESDIARFSIIRPE